MARRKGANMRYIQVNRLTELPDISAYAPFKVVLAVEEPVSAERQKEISTWLVEMGCRYVMSCGEQCDSWSTSVRAANLAMFDLETMSAKNFVMTTSHSREPLRSVFWYAKNSARHPELTFDDCVVLHLAGRDRSVEYKGIYEKS